MRDRDVEFDVIEYLKHPLSREDLEHFLELLAVEPAELVRKDKNFKELGLNADDYVTKEAVVAILLKHPNLMQRPVVVKGDQAILARPSSTIEALL
ncbi:MAG: ArsC/Spx/MgsR family protein [Gammaproteobacteria bacterium]